MSEQNKKGSVLTKILKVLGIIALTLLILLIILILVLILVKPYGIDITKLPAALSNSEQQSSYDHPLLSNEQEVFLESMGIDPADIPTQITADQEQCLRDSLGSDRVNDILQGASPGLSDYLKAEHCF